MSEHWHSAMDTIAPATATGKANSASQVLAARAKVLATEMESAASDASDYVEVLEFGLADETYAFELAYVREIGALVELTPLPGVPAFVMGITCMHGHIIAVVDLRKIIGLPERGLRNSRQVIVLQSDDMEFGILGERVIGVRRLSLAGMQTSLPTLTDMRAAYLKGIAADGTVLLSAARLLADPQLVVCQKP
jgi:purine-binding chemotaxis protein CheW